LPQEISCGFLCNTFIISNEYKLQSEWNAFGYESADKVRTTDLSEYTPADVL